MLITGSKYCNERSICRNCEELQIFRNNHHDQGPNPMSSTAQTSNTKHSRIHEKNAQNSRIHKTLSRIHKTLSIIHNRMCCKHSINILDVNVWRSFCVSLVTVNKWSHLCCPCFHPRMILKFHDSSCNFWSCYHPTSECWRIVCYSWCMWKSWPQPSDAFSGLPPDQIFPTMV